MREFLLALELVVMPQGGRTSILHACLNTTDSHDGFLNSHLILCCLVSRSALATAPSLSFSVSLSIWLLFVVILLRKIAHILWAQ